MKLLKVIRYSPLLVTAMLFLASCGSNRFATYSDYDRSANVRNYETFAVADSLAASTGTNPILTNDFNRQRFVEAVKKEMVGRGYKESKEPEMVAILKMRSRNRTQSNYMPAYSPWGMGWGMGGYGNTYTTSYEEVLVAVDLREVASGRLLWQGVVGAKQEDYTSKPEKRIPAAISDLFMRYPDGRPKAPYDPMNQPEKPAKPVSQK
jgi:hypothetical protein